MPENLIPTLLYGWLLLAAIGAAVESTPLASDEAFTWRGALRGAWIGTKLWFGTWAIATAAVFATGWMIVNLP